MISKLVVPKSVRPANQVASTISVSILALATAMAAVAPWSAEAAPKPRPVKQIKAPAQSNSFFGDFSAYQSPKPYRAYSPPKPRTARAAGDAAAKTAKAAETVAEKPIKGPVVLTVSIAQQRVTVHDADGPIAEAPISSGQPGFATPMGVFSLLEKSVVHHSNLYGGAPMPNMQRITWSGVALHAGALPGYPASHGCIRLPYNFSKKLYGMTKLGTRVIVAREMIAPVPFSHPKMIVPLPPEPVLSSADPFAKPVDAAAAKPTRVAEQVDYESVRGLSLITSAVAAELPSGMVPENGVRSAYRAARAAELARLEQDVKTAEAAKIDAETRAKLAVEAANTVKAGALKAKVDAEQRAQVAKQTEQAWLESDRALEALNRKFSGQEAPVAAVMEKVLQTEAALESKSNELHDATTSARQDAERGAIARAAAEANILVAVKDVKNSATLLAKTALELKTAQASLESFRRAQLLRKHPVSIFISRATKRLYVRQAYEPLFDVPVTIDSPEALIGTHVLTALEYINGNADLRWSAVSVPTAAAALKQEPAKKKNGKIVQAAPAPIVTASLPQKPGTALDRITIPEDARERIADLLKPGSSIMISDYGISNETGKFTDFIILTR